MSAASDACAIKYAQRLRTASQNFFGGDPHAGPVPIDHSGHDPEVLNRYPAPSKKLQGVVARLDWAVSLTG